MKTLLLKNDEVSRPRMKEVIGAVEESYNTSGMRFWLSGDSFSEPDVIMGWPAPLGGDPLGSSQVD